MYERTYVGTYVRKVDDVMAIKPNFLASMGYQYFLSYGALRARSSAKMRTEDWRPALKWGLKVKCRRQTTDFLSMYHGYISITSSADRKQDYSG